MKPNQASVTAENNALLKAHECMLPAHHRICSDPYAICFLPERFQCAADRSRQIKETVANWDAFFPGVGNAIIARTRYIDNCLKEAIHAGMRQLVILGAGYDTRAIRFKDLLEGVTVFELDHPTTQQTKMERINTFITMDLSHVRFIPIDFSAEAFNEKLLGRGKGG
jgi:methyltransferase (TIGR00027 family)